MISIIIPVYNMEKYLSQCLDSLIRQSFRDIEIILVDDGSIDKSLEICEEYARKDRRIKTIHQENKGVSIARNAGLQIAKGELIGFVDPDDWVSPDMYELMINAMNKTQADLAICGYAYCNEDGSVQRQCMEEQGKTEIMTQKETLRKMSDIPPSLRHCVWNKLFRKKLLGCIFFPTSLCSAEDVWFLTEYLLRIQSSVIVHKALYFNRIRTGSATHGGLSIHSLANSFAAHHFMYSAFIGVYPDQKDYDQAFLLDVYLLKYNAALQKSKELKGCTEADFADLRRMRHIIRLEGVKALFNGEIGWKTRLAYLLV